MTLQRFKTDCRLWFWISLVLFLACWAVLPLSDDQPSPVFLYLPDMFSVPGDVLTDLRLVGEKSLEWGIPAIVIGWVLQGVVVVGRTLTARTSRGLPSAATVQRRWMLPSLSVLAIALTFAFGFFRSERDTVEFIHYLVRQNQAGNELGSTERQLTDHLRGAGANVNSSASVWRVNYDGLFFHRRWEFSYVPPKHSKSDVDSRR